MESFKQMKIIAVYTQLKQLRNKAWKKIQAWNGVFFVSDHGQNHVDLLGIVID